MLVSDRSWPSGHQRCRWHDGLDDEWARRRGRNAALVAHTFVRDQDSLERLLSRLKSEERIALDTEFHRERTYFPRLALIQLAWSDGIAIIDPLSVDPTSITEIFDANHLIVLHAAQQDMDVLTHAVGAVPSRMFDTQIAAGFLGFSTPSL
ncbi:MAG: hypothetical protein EBZ93_05870, partial [Actinobacteria bacterium]|nr:hypothetical protein [Actinomycetota bacterium]